MRNNKVNNIMGTLRTFIKLIALVAMVMVATPALAQQSWKNIGVVSSTVDRQLCRYNSTGSVLECDATNPYVAADGDVGIGTSAPEASLDVSTTDALILPRGTDAQQPGTPVNGMLRYNEDNNKFEAYENGAWAETLPVKTSTLLMLVKQ
jgi:hypothetical protein